MTINLQFCNIHTVHQYNTKALEIFRSSKVGCIFTLDGPAVYLVMSLRRWQISCTLRWRRVRAVGAHAGVSVAGPMAVGGLLPRPVRGRVQERAHHKTGDHDPAHPREGEHGVEEPARLEVRTERGEIWPN